MKVEGTFFNSNVYLLFILVQVAKIELKDSNTREPTKQSASVNQRRKLFLSAGGGGGGAIAVDHATIRSSLLIDANTKLVRRR